MEELFYRMDRSKILIIDDSVTTADALSHILIKKNYIVTDIAHSGEDAIKKKKKNRPDLILLDIDLKGKINSILGIQ